MSILLLDLILSNFSYSYAQNEFEKQTFKGPRKLPEAHKKVCNENKRNKKMTCTSKYY